MQCSSCSYWTVSSLTLKDFLNQWDEFIGAPVTPGYQKRYDRKAAKTGVPVDNVELFF